MKDSGSRQTQLAVIAPLIPFVLAPALSVALESSLPSSSQRALAVAGVVVLLALIVIGVQHVMRVRPTRKLGPAALAVLLGAITSVGALATSFMN